jgi:hypothetical protein
MAATVMPTTYQWSSSSTLSARQRGLELEEDGDTLFGLADLGFGFPELGSFSLSDLVSLRLPLGMGIERDILFEGTFPLSVYAEAARTAGRIVIDEQSLRRAADAIRANR